VRGFDDGGASRSGAGDVCRQKMDAVSVEVASGAVVVLGGSGVGVSGEDLGVAQGDAGVEGVGNRGVVVCPSPTRHLHQPEIAAVGASVDTPGHIVRTCRRDEVDRAVTEDQTGGLTRLVLDRGGRIAGATIVGPRAGETLTELTLAIRQGPVRRRVVERRHRRGPGRLAAAAGAMARRARLSRCAAPPPGPACDLRARIGSGRHRPPPRDEKVSGRVACWNGPVIDDGLPLLRPKDYSGPSLFEPANLLREARRQKNLPTTGVPRVGLLDPDGDIVRFLATSGNGRRHPGWACYHTDMWTTDLDGLEVGVVGMAVGGPFAVLVAEQLAASGAELVLSIASAGQVAPLPHTPCFVLIERALRDEGTSVHYLPPGRWSRLDSRLGERLTEAFTELPEPVLAGASWTTDAPYRETADAIAGARGDGVVCVEMEAAALYAYATARERPVVCLAHVTNTMATEGADFEKGPANGVHTALAVARAAAVALR